MVHRPSTRNELLGFTATDTSALLVEEVLVMVTRAPTEEHKTANAGTCTEADSPSSTTHTGGKGHLDLDTFHSEEESGTRV